MFTAPKEYVEAKMLQKVGNYFTELIVQKWHEKKVAVLVEDSLTSLYFFPCNENGYPDSRYLNYLEIDSPLGVASWGDQTTPIVGSCTVWKKEIAVQRPLLVFEEPWELHTTPTIYMWSGKVMQNSKMPLENLDVKYLMKLAQEAIKNREGIYIDKVIENKLIK